MTDRAPKPSSPAPPPAASTCRRSAPASPKLLFVVFGLFALLTVNSVYLVAVRLLEATSGKVYQNWFYLVNVPRPPGARAAARRAGGGLRHRAHPQRLATGPTGAPCASASALFATALVLLVSGVVLTRIEGVIEVKDPTVRSVAYWLHVITPAARGLALRPPPPRRAAHQVEGRAALGGGGAAPSPPSCCSSTRRTRGSGTSPARSRASSYFFPSLARTATGNFIPEKVLMANDYCAAVPRRRRTAHWQQSVHRFSSFNNPPYLFSVRETRKCRCERDGDLRAARWCAGCHDPAVFFSRQVRRPEVRRRATIPPARPGSPAPSATRSPTSTARAATPTTRSRSRRTTRSPSATTPPCGGSTASWSRPSPSCTSRRSSSRCTGRRSSAAPATRCTCRPSSTTTSSCAARTTTTPSCSPASPGHGVQSFYYPPKATPNCAGCHMPLARERRLRRPRLRRRRRPRRPRPPVPGANTAIPALVGMPPDADRGPPQVQRRGDARRPLRRQGGRHRSTASSSRRCGRRSRR